MQERGYCLVPKNHCMDKNNVLTWMMPLQMALHRCNTIVLSLLPDCHRPGAGGSSDFWLLKAVAQQFDLRIYHATDARAVQADRALLAGEIPLQTDWRYSLPAYCAMLCYASS